VSDSHANIFGEESTTMHVNANATFSNAKTLAFEPKPPNLTNHRKKH